MRGNRLVLGIGVLLLVVLISDRLCAQETGATLLGTVTNATGGVVPNAKVSVKNVATGESREAATNSAGIYTVPDPVAGDYEVSVSADGSAAKTSKVSLTRGKMETLDFVLGAQAQSPAAAQEPVKNLPSAPSSTQTKPSLQDLGFPPEQTKGSAQEQARLDKRTHMLKIHQRLGLITTAPLVATVISGGFAGGRSTSSTPRDLHAALGAATAGLYFTAASYAIFAPKISGTPTRGPIRLHKALAWIHGPGMVLTPILGVMAYEQKSRGERVHGVASAHSAVAIVTAGAYGAALLSVSLKF
ncbi:MAG TPA: carboxypeptidase-like regulatory domain-containing protein [Terriglobales bacterium]|nr:carboxypeptidase-like regulatory domain-containing protein [Terriglobales bacterium]